MTIIKPSTAFKAGADWVSAEVRAYIKDQVATHLDTAQDVRDNDFEQTRFLYVRTKAATYRLDLSSGAVDDGDTVLRDNVGRRYIKVAGSGSGTAWDVQVDDLAARAAYDGEEAGFSVLVADIGDGRAAVYERIGAAGNWTDPAFLSGPGGPPGPAGDGFNPAGAWAIGTTYDKNDMVSHDGRSFVSFADGNVGNEPPDSDSDDAYWQFVPAAVGPANTLTIGTVDVGPADASITGTAPNQTLNLTIPQGPAGDDGDDGAAATIAVGTVTTVNPGNPATVTNVGTSAAAVFDFEIPKGQDGTGAGDVVGPSSSVAGNMAVFADSSGKEIEDGGPPFSGDYGDLDNRPTLGTMAAETASDYTKTSGLGGAALLNVGTTAGTVAAGDDSRINGNAKLAVEDQTLTGGARVTSKDLGTISSGTVTPDPGDRPLQHYINGGAHTLAPGGNTGSYLLDITNNSSAGAITTSGWTKVSGDAFTTTNGHKFRCHCSVGDAGSYLVVGALQ